MTKEEWNELEHTLVTVGCYADLAEKEADK